MWFMQYMRYLSQIVEVLVVKVFYCTGTFFDILFQCRIEEKCRDVLCVLFISFSIRR